MFQSSLDREEHSVKTYILKVLSSLHNDESGQDLIEYALVAALIAFGAVTTMGTLAGDIDSAFSIIGSNLVSAL
jgi:pilus assembly protein Flp/PilA